MFAEKSRVTPHITLWFDECCTHITATIGTYKELSNSEFDETDSLMAEFN